MKFTRINPIKINILPISGSILITKFIIKGNKQIIKINANVYIYHKDLIYRNKINIASSETVSIYTSKEDRAYKIRIKIPEFNYRIQSDLYFSIDPKEYIYAEAYIDSINIIGFYSQEIKNKEDINNKEIKNKEDISNNKEIKNKEIENKEIENKEIDNKEIDGPIIEELPLLKTEYFDLKPWPLNLLSNSIYTSPKPSIFEIIDQMIDKYDLKLSKDSTRRISYIFPLYSHDSFHIVAANHIRHLRNRYSNDFEIEEIDWSKIGNINWDTKRNILIHPFLYPFASTESFTQNSRNFAKLLAMKNKVGGFDVADSNRISKFAIHLINKIDLIMVPSTFAKDSYINSGVTIPVEILPHGIPEEFLIDEYKEDIDINKDILELREFKKRGNILVLFFLVHSEHRKGADIVKAVMSRIQKKFGNVYLVVKGPSCRYFLGINTIHIRSWMNNNNLKALYDTCDICLSPSRGGGFELNALEAISRGIPTLVTNGGCFLDIINYFIPINVNNKVTQPLPGNSIHIGYGYEADINDLEVKLSDAINRLEYWQNIFKNNSKEIRKKYSWDSAVNKLEQYLRNYGFME